MSEFQYYEFRAIDHALGKKEMDQLRKYSSRATITERKFVNFYSYGNFKGDGKKWMEKYFDAFLYYANWGTRILVIRFPAKLLDKKVAKQFCQGESVRCWSTAKHTIVEFRIDEVEEQGWLDEENNYLAELLPLRQEIMSGDFRVLYLGWLLSVQNGLIAGDKIEPPVPPGLKEMSPALISFTEFFGLDKALCKIAARKSEALKSALSMDDIGPGIAGMSCADKFHWLGRLAFDKNPNLQTEFMNYLLPNCGLEEISVKMRRRVKDLKM